jgi:hypothetical protein
MTLSIDVKNKVIELRKLGMTFSEINGELGLNVHKSTLSYICKNVKLPNEYYIRIKELNQQNRDSARLKAVASNKIKRDSLLKGIEESAREEISKLSKDNLKIALAMLYLGEGSKWASFRGLILSNSDPRIILIYVHLLRICYGISKDELKFRISYRVDQDFGQLKKYWAKILGVKTNQFYNTIPDPRTKNTITLRSDYKGVCGVYCKGTTIQLTLDAMADELLKYLSDK